MGYSFCGFLEERFKGALIRAVKRFITCDNVREVPVKIRDVSILYIDTSVLLKYEDKVQLPTVLTADIQSDEDGRSYHRALQLHASITGTFSRYFDDLIVTCTGHCRSFPHRGNLSFADDLLPRMTREEMETQATRLLDRAYDYRYVHRRPTWIDPILIAKKLGINLYAARLTADGSIRGAYIFSDTMISVYNDQRQSYYQRPVKGNSIVIEMNLRNDPNMFRFTIMHEIIHAYVQRFAFYLVAMSDQEFSAFRCPKRTNEELTFLDNFVERMERQADMIASYTLMPKEAFAKKADALFAECGALRTSGCVSIKSLLSKGMTQ